MSAKAWWRTGLIYQVYPRSFQDTNGDGVGDLNGIAQLVDPGVDAVWIAPIFLSPMRDFGYDISEYCDIHLLSGSLADFDNLLGAAHAIGLKVILDLVPNRTSDRHPFEKSRLSKMNAKRDWLRLARPQAGRLATEQLGKRVRRLGLDVRHLDRATA